MSNQNKKKKKGNKGGGKKKHKNNNKSKRNKQNKKNKQNKQNNKIKKQQKQQPKITKKLFNLEHSVKEQTDLLVHGFIRNKAKKNKIPSEIIVKCLQFASNLFSIQSSILSVHQNKLLISHFSKKFKDKKKTKFNCIFNAKHDGFDAETFHNKCNNKRATLVVIKSNYNFIFGGFTNSSWIKPNIKKSIYKYTRDNDAFLFGFKNKNDKLCIYNIEFSSADCAIENSLNHGPIFGYSDIFIGNDCNKNKNSSFCKPCCYNLNGKQGNELCGGSDDSISEGYYNFIVDNYEVFQFT